jgi:hypothetical protein
MVAQIRDEADFQAYVVNSIWQIGRSAHVQILDEGTRWPGVPDLTVAYGVEYWLELKYDKFKSGLELFKPKQLKRQQVEWLDRRHEATRGRAYCGILGFIHLGQVKPLKPFMYYIPVHHYLAYFYEKEVSLDPTVLHQYSTSWPAGGISGRDILRFIRETGAEAG